MDHPMTEPREQHAGLPAGWQRERCSYCLGSGLASNYAGEPDDCTHCDGGGVYVTPKGRRVRYPGGPFCG